MWSALTRQLVEAAYAEDVGPGDITAALLPAPDRPVHARLVLRREGVVCGLALAPLICEVFSRRLGVTLDCPPALFISKGRTCADGDLVEAGAQVAGVSGPHAAVLTLERTLLNFLGRLTGVATLTRRYVEAARRGNPDVAVLDTRKTLPGWRELDKYAVRIGGGANHRTGLFDAVLIKDNHLAGVPVERLGDAVTRLAAQAPTPRQFLEVEVDALEQFAAVCRAPGVDIVLLDNFTPAQLRAAVQMRAALRRAPGGPAPLLLEASGGVTLETIAAIAATGVERISVGALTHSAVAVDLGLDF